MHSNEIGQAMCIKAVAQGLVTLFGTKIETTDVSYVKSYDHGGLLLIYCDHSKAEISTEENYIYEVQVWEYEEKVLSILWHENGRHSLQQYDPGPWEDSLMSMAVHLPILN